MNDIRMAPVIPEQISGRLAEIERELATLGLLDSNDIRTVEDAHQRISTAQKAIKEANERSLLRGLEMTKLENQRDTINWVVAAFQASVPPLEAGAKEPQDAERTTDPDDSSITQKVLHVLSQANRPLSRQEICESDPEKFSRNTVSIALSQLKAKRLVDNITTGKWTVRTTDTQSTRWLR